MHIRKQLLLIFTFIASSYLVMGQDVEQMANQISNAKWITVTGGLGLNGSAYSSFGIKNRRDPFAYSLSANLNINFKGIVDAPFSVYMTSQNKTFNTPAYNFIGISPRYKWLTAHIGSRSMNMSQFTYSGTTFLGGGFELMPEEFIVKGKAFYGRLVKAVEVGDTLQPIIQLPVYERWGGAGMITIGTQSNNVDIIFFKGKDRENSIGIIDTSLSVKPEENMVLGLNTKQKIGDHFLFALEYGFSAYTRDTRQPEVEYDEFTYANNFGSLFRPRASSYYAHAINVKADYQADLFTAGVAYQRIDPNYQTMGALYMTNDVEDITVNATAVLLDRKINASGNFGYQHNNLKNKSEAVDKRFITSLNLSYAITENLNTSASFSNYNTSTEAVRIVVYDSIKYGQINNNFSANVSYSIPKETLNHLLDFSVIIQNMNTINNQFTDIESTNNQMNGINAGYRLAFTKIDFTAGVNSSFNRNHMEFGKDISGSGGLTFTKGFFKKKLQTSLGFLSILTDGEGENASIINTVRLSLTYRFLKRHNLNFNTNYMHRNITNGNGEKKTSGEWVGTIAYSFAF